MDAMDLQNRALDRFQRSWIDPGQTNALLRSSQLRPVDLLRGVS
jgi:hypothetical protein